MSAELDSALIEAAREMIVEQGLGVLTIDALVKKVGTTRPAFYRRYKDLPELIMRLLRDPLPPREDLKTGTLQGDLHVFAARIAAYLANPVVKRALPGLLLNMTTDPCAAETAQEQFFTPQYETLAQVLDDATARGETPEGIDPAELFELLTGPLLARTLLRGGDPDTRLVANVVDGTLDILTGTARR